MKKTDLFNAFRMATLEFCERNNMTPEQVGHKAGYYNRDRIDNVFNNKIGKLAFPVTDRFIDVMKKIEPGFNVELKAKKGKVKEDR